MLVGMLAMVFDRLLGDPDFLWRRFPHPVVIFGCAIDYMERWGNKAHQTAVKRRIFGMMTLLVLLVGAVFVGELFTLFCRLCGPVGIILEALIASIFLAQKSLGNHVSAVQHALDLGGVEQARREVAKIVGRQTGKLDEAGVCRAAIESLAENSSDGVVAPFFWLLLFGLPGIFAYKMLNTADSMIGHKNERFHAFGFAAAKADDIANYVPARLCALLAIGASWLKYGRTPAFSAWRVMREDAMKHPSPNAGWSESIYAGALGISLAGPRFYGDIYVDSPYQNAGGRAPCRDDIGAGLALFWVSMNLALVLVGMVFMVNFLLE